MDNDFFDASAQIKDPRTHAIIGAAMEVHRELGGGFLEAVYQEALAIELSRRGVPFVREQGISVCYKGTPLACAYRADFICLDQVIVEVKALSDLSGAERAQVINYLKATRMQVGLLLNFGSQRLQYERFVLTGRGKDLSPPRRVDSDDADVRR